MMRTAGAGSEQTNTMYDQHTGLLTEAFTGTTGQFAAFDTSQYNTYEATRQTVEIMCRLTRAATHYANVQGVAQNLLGNTIADVTQNDEQALIGNLWDWVTDNVRLVEDERLIEQGVDGRELLISPEMLLTMYEPKGDCDDFSMLTASVLLLWGYEVKFVTGAGSAEHPNLYSHVWVKVKLKTSGEWLDMDCSHGPWLGWNVITAMSRTVADMLVTEWAV